jgi:archaeal cell division control protein 6
MNRFTTDQTIFTDMSVLREEYVPEELPARDEQMDQFEFALQPIVQGAGPENVLTYGETGVGKTVCARRILSALQSALEDVDDVELEVVWCNCEGSTSYQVAVDLLNELRDPNDQISRNGHARSDVMEKLWEEIDDLDATDVVFVLDEIDSVGSDDSLLYKIPRAKANGETEKNIGLIGICNDFTFRNNLSARVKSTLREHEVHFGPYDAGELQEILEQRAELAFVDGALEGAVIPYIAAEVGRDSGSARHAIDILSLAGRIAENEGSAICDESHARRAADRLEELIVEKELSAMTTQSQAILQAILSLSQSGELPARRKTVHKEYKKVVNLADYLEPKSSRTVHDRLSQLSLKGIISVHERNKGESGGRSFEYDLDLDDELVDKVLGTVDDLQPYRDHREKLAR